MTSDDPKGFVEAFDERWDEYRKQFKAARREISEETIHDLRVAARRIQALLEIVRWLDPHPRVKKVRRFLKKQLSQLDELHDAQVMQNEVGQSLERLPQLASFQAFLEKRVSKLTRAASKKLLASKPSDLKKRAKRIRAVVNKHSQEDSFSTQLLEAVDSAYSDTLQPFKAIDAQQPDTIHHVRIASKKFRYMVEMVEPFLPGYPKTCFDRMHDYQDAMGKIRDTTVLLDTLDEFEKKHPGAARQDEPPSGPAAVRSYYEKRLADLIRSYLERKDELKTLWRTVPGRSFPWENSHEPIHHPPRDRRTSGQQQQRAGRQPATTDGRGAQKDASDREGAEGNGNGDRPDPDQPVSPGG